jgi:hypothetical protein
MRQMEDVAMRILPDFPYIRSLVIVATQTDHTKEKGIKSWGSRWTIFQSSSGKTL